MWERCGICKKYIGNDCECLGFGEATHFILPKKLTEHLGEPPKDCSPSKPIESDQSALKMAINLSLSERYPNGKPVDGRRK